MNARLFFIGEAAKSSGLTVKTIRYYEEIGLISKVGRTNDGVHTGGHRVYTKAEVGRLMFIHHAHLFALSLADIRKLLALTDSKGCPSRQPEYQEILRRHLREIDERINHLLGLRAAMNNLVSPARQRKVQKCSWSTYECMKQHAGSPPPSGASSFGGEQKKGGNHV